MIFRRTTATCSALPGLSFSPRLVVHKGAQPSNLPTDAHSFADLTRPEKCTELVPVVIQRAIPRLRRNGQLGDRLHDRDCIRLVDGTSVSAKMQLRPVAGRSKLHSSEDTPRIGHLRMEQRMHNSMLVILTNLALPHSIRNVPWRLSRVQLSPDFRHCTVYWAIDAHEQSREIRETVGLAFQRALPTVRYHLAKHFTLGFTPDVKFELEEAVEVMPSQCATLPGQVISGAVP